MIQITDTVMLHLHPFTLWREGPGWTTASLILIIDLPMMIENWIVDLIGKLLVQLQVTNN